MWLAFLSLFGTTAALAIYVWSTRHHVGIPIFWLAFLLLLLAFAVERTIRWSRSRRSGPPPRS